MLARGHEAGDVGHVHHQQRAHFIGDLAELGKVDGAGVGAGAGDDQFRLVLEGEAAHLVVVDALGLFIEVVGHEVEVLAGEVDGAAVGKVAAVGKAHAQHGVARL